MGREPELPPQTAIRACYGVMIGNGVAFTQADWPEPLNAWILR
jgi:hypothetical protein